MLFSESISAVFLVWVFKCLNIPMGKPLTNDSFLINQNELDFKSYVENHTSEV